MVEGHGVDSCCRLEDRRPVLLTNMTKFRTRFEQRHMGSVDEQNAALTFVQFARVY